MSGEIKVLALLRQESVVAELATVCPKNVDPSDLLAQARGAVAQNPDLAACDPYSVLLAVKKATMCGLPLDGRHAHLVPFKKRVGDNWVKMCQFIVDAKGYITLGLRCGISTIHPAMVYEADDFAEWTDDSGPHFRHEINHRMPRGKVIGVLVVTKNTKGDVDHEYMTVEEVKSIEARSKAQFGPWKTDWNEMAKKTAIRRMSKRWDIDTRYRALLDADDDRLEPIERRTTRVQLEPEATPALAGGPVLTLPEPEAPADTPVGEVHDIDPVTGEFTWR